MQNSWLGEIQIRLTALFSYDAVYATLLLSLCGEKKNSWNTHAVLVTSEIMTLMTYLINATVLVAMIQHSYRKKKLWQINGQNLMSNKRLVNMF